MITRSSGRELEPLNLEIEATARRNREGVVNANEGNHQGAQVRVEDERRDDRQGWPNAQGVYYPPPNAQGGGGNNQGGYYQGYYPPPQMWYPPPQGPNNQGNYPQGPFPQHVPYYQERPLPQVPRYQEPPHPIPNDYLGRPIREYFEAPVREYYDGLARPGIQANNFEISPSLLRMLREHQFEGKDENEDPNHHFAQFLELADTIKYNGVSEDAKRLRMFSFTLIGKAKAWLYSITPGTVTTWEDLSKRFLMKFYLPVKTVQAKNGIAQFKQGNNESLQQAWDRFNNLLLACPQHGFPREQTICFFYCGLKDVERQHLDACSGGSIWMKMAEEITNIMEGIASNSFQLTIDRGNHHRVAQLEEKDDLKTMIMTLMQKVEAISTSSQKKAIHPFIQGNVNQEREMEEVSFMGRQGYQGPQGNFGQGRQGQFQPQGQQPFQPQGQFPNQGQGRYNSPNYQSGQGNQAYNPNQRKNDNFSYANQKAAVPFPPGFEPGAKLPNNEGKPSTDEMLALIYKEIKEKDVKVDEYMKATSSKIKNLEFQMSQLATTVGHMQNKGKFPSTTEPNPKEHCKAVELRSGKRYESPPLPIDLEEE
ncbi:hypothetical protein ACS0TY_006161 [Phlomoides rotata]